MRKLNLDIEQIIQLTNAHKTPTEIGAILGVDESNIRNRLKEVGKEPYRKITRKNSQILNKVEELLNQQKTNQQIADELGICASTVRKYTYELGYNTNSIKTKTLTEQPITLTEEQWEVLYGSLLGDMSLDLNWKNARPVISQGGNQREYFDHKCAIFQNLIGKPSTTDRYDSRTKKYYHKYAVKFLTNPIYTKLKEELYPNGVKTVTQQWLDKITPRGLAFWFMDDGTNVGTIATNCFTYEECSLIIDWFMKKWGISCTLHKSVNNGHLQYLTYIKKGSRTIFYNLVIPYIIPSMLYKLSGWNPKPRELRETP